MLLGPALASLPCAIFNYVPLCVRPDRWSSRSLIEFGGEWRPNADSDYRKYTDALSSLGDQTTPFCEWIALNRFRERICRADHSVHSVHPLNDIYSCRVQRPAGLQSGLHPVGRTGV